jgi:peptidoglycan/xylan/chitin deacetylase (PgdA/CDA1 family)
LPRDRANQSAVYERLRNHAKEVFYSDDEFVKFFDSQCNRLEEIVGSSLSNLQATNIFSATMKEEDIRTLSTDGSATIGSHTVDHIRLDRVSMQECSHQLKQSKTILEEITQRRCDQFCYPNGNFNSNIANSVRACGYRSAVGATAGFNPAGADRYQLKRIHLPDHANSARLASLLSGFEFAVDRLRMSLRRQIRKESRQ